MARLNRFVIRMVAASLLLGTSSCATAQAEMDTASAEPDMISQLQQALRYRVTIYTHPRTGFMKPSYHCRRASEGCDRRMEEFAHYLRDAGEHNGIDPWLLAAMAFRESGLNPWAVGAVGELGILQLHPGNPRSKNVRFVHDPSYRQRCQKEVGACQREVVDRAAELLARAVSLCGGSLEQGLSMYNTGRCDGNTSYARRVRGEVLRLKSAIGMPLDERPGDDAARLAAAQPDPEPTPEETAVADMVFGLEEIEQYARDYPFRDAPPSTLHTSTVHASTAH